MAASIKSTGRKAAVASHRRRMRGKGLMRVEVQVARTDAVLVRDLAKALLDPRRQSAVRTLLRERLGELPTADLKALLAAAPLEGIDLHRATGFDREVDL